MAVNRCSSRAPRRPLAMASHSKAMWSPCCNRFQLTGSSRCGCCLFQETSWMEFSRSMGWRRCGQGLARRANGHTQLLSLTTDDQSEVFFEGGDDEQAWAYRESSNGGSDHAVGHHGLVRGAGCRTATDTDAKASCRRADEEANRPCARSRCDGSERGASLDPAGKYQ